MKSIVQFHSRWGIHTHAGSQHSSFEYVCLKSDISALVWCNGRSAGSAVEVSWTQKAWHGGGYQYRLCPADMPLNEECFQKMPLPFVGNASLRWGGVGGSGAASMSFTERCLC